MNAPAPMEDVNTTVPILLVATIVHVPILLVILSMRMVTIVLVKIYLFNYVVNEYNGFTIIMIAQLSYYNTSS